MHEIDNEHFYNEVGKVNGWDFSNVKCQSEGIEWDFYEEVTKRCKSSDILLDIGTGGGENILKIATFFFLIVGIDLSSEMVEKARINRQNTDVKNVRFFQMSSQGLQFPTDFFDIISCCHAPFAPNEIAKVLKKEGVFLTQQVSEGDKINLKRAFGRGQAFQEKDGMLKEKYVQELRKAGFSNVQSFEYDATEYYQEPEDLLFLLTHTPIIPNFGEGKEDFKILHRFMENNQTEKGIRTNSKRFMIMAEK
ncbi:ubiquinone/menaquinone biosynthesis C-methylase UbiE [Lederbergia galactosidilyticus]|uniref:class I SAM-dependent methyltransferase n=1 Tax=Lederbergia galactosidilytica TaxID=217031 RepID=UPI001AE1D361|nr:class I SAM-dependent methyltransferase [Lederbergia galactosidilytica]MBP1914041.1 ubiquinone/menaquinone biosynthesis C-methylase UbiE [Lederbergia galactosidilytica]